MKYFDARPLIRSGDLLAFSHGGWGTWKDIKVNLVRMFTRSTYSHVGIAWVVGENVFVLEAVKPKLRIFPLSASGDFYLLPMHAPWLQQSEDYALRKIGTDYSEMVAFRAFFGPLVKGSVQQCAAYAREILLCDGVDLGNRSTPDAVVYAALQLGCDIDFISNPGDTP